MSKRAAATSSKGAVSSEQDKNGKSCDKASILENEPHAISLSQWLVAYSRRGEEEDTIVLRELSNRSTFDHFGVKGAAELERLFYTTLGLLYEKRAMLTKRARFGEGEDLRELFEGMNDDDREKMKCALDALNSNSGKRGRRGMTVELRNMDKCPQLALFRFDDNNQLMYGLYMFVRPAIKFVRYLNTRFDFSKSECLSLTEKKEMTVLEKYTDDNFF